MMTSMPLRRVAVAFAAAGTLALGVAAPSGELAPAAQAQTSSADLDRAVTALRGISTMRANFTQTDRAGNMARGTMTPADFEAILSKQMPDTEKRRRADFLIWTDTLEDARAQVQYIVRQLKERSTHA